MIEFFKNLSTRGKIIWLISSLAVLVIVIGTVIFLSQPKHDDTKFKLKESSGRVATSSSSSEDEEEEKGADYYSDTHNRAVEKLENPNIELPEKKDVVKQAIDKAIEGLKKNPENKANNQYGYGLTTNDMVQVMHQALSSGYEPQMETLVVHKSDYDGIYQFVFDMVREKDNTRVSIAGNFSEEQGQVQFSVQVGSIQIAQ